MSFFRTHSPPRIATLLLFASAVCVAQQPSNSSALPDTPSAQSNSPAQTSDPAKTEEEKKKQQQEQAKRELEAEKQQHLLGVVPTYNAVYSGQALPLNPRQKFDLAIAGAITPYQFAMTGIVAAFGQAQNSFPEYGQGFKGYAKRYGAGYTDYFNGQMLGNALLPVVLHQDPRYFRKGEGSFNNRLWWAMASTIRCKGDNGKWQPNVSNVAGNIMAGGISNLYYPASDRGVGLTFERGMVVTAQGVVGAVILEFAPDINGRLFHKKQQTKQASQP